MEPVFPLLSGISDRYTLSWKSDILNTDDLIKSNETLAKLHYDMHGFYENLEYKKQ